MKARLNLVGAAFALTALSYGLARFAYGLMLPQIREDLTLSATTAGWIGGSAFAAYCFGIVFAFTFDARLGERRIAVLAGLTATCGMGLVAAAPSALLLGLAIALAGLSTGLTSPPLAVAVSRCFDETARPRANGAVNAGTAAGIIMSGVAVLTFAGNWRELYAMFAVIGAAVTVWLWFAMPRMAHAEVTEQFSLRDLTRDGVAGLSASAFLTGAASTAIWTFGASVLRDDLRFPDERIAIAWIILGAAGVFGAGTGLLTNRFGLRVVHRLSLGVMALALSGLAFASFYPSIAFGVMGLFGVAYIIATGTFLLWGLGLYADRPATGLGIPFLLLAIGQTAGSPLFGAVVDQANSATALVCFATLMVGAAIWSARQPHDPRS